MAEATARYESVEMELKCSCGEVDYFEELLIFEDTASYLAR